MRRRPRLAAVASVASACALLVAACRDDGRPPADYQTLVFTLGGRALAIEAPPGAEAAVVTDLRARIALRPGARNPQTIEITLAPEDAHAAANDAPPPTHFFTTTASPGGSGGEEAVLEGVWWVGGRRYDVTCRTQREGATPDDAAWCAPLLMRLREAQEAID